MRHIVFETGSGKWVKIDSGTVIYTSNKSEATLFSFDDLRSANGFFEDFTVYRRTLHAVPKGGNMSPSEYPTVLDYLRKAKAPA